MVFCTVICSVVGLAAIATWIAMLLEFRAGMKSAAGVYAAHLADMVKERTDV